MRPPFKSQASYNNNPIPMIECECLEEAKYWMEQAIEFKKKKDLKGIREASCCLLEWLSEGARVPKPKFSLRKVTGANRKARGEAFLGLWDPSNTTITVWMDMHKEEDGRTWFSEYLETLLHEWIHLYEDFMFGMTTEHDEIFNIRLRNLIKEFRKSSKIKKVLK